MIDKDSSLEEILAHVWGSIARGSADTKHAYHFPVLATSENNSLSQRTIVLRAADIKKRHLICYSDIRTQKVKDIKANPDTSWLFYDHQYKEQIRASAKATIHHQDEVAEQLWEQIPPKNRGDYLGPHAPGTEVEQYSNNLPDDFSQQPTEENTQAGWKNFSVIVSEVYAIDFLKLMKGGHLRNYFAWEDGQWTMQWITP